jgi:hypothetical protein
MSHRDDCPTEYEARRRGYSAGESGDYGRNPYRHECDEAASAWDRGYRSGQYDREENEAREARATARRRREEEEEAFELANYERDYYTEAERQYFAEMEQEEAEHWAQVETEDHIGRIVTAIECSEGFN